MVIEKKLSTNQQADQYQAACSKRHPISELQYWRLVESLPFGVVIQHNNQILFANNVLIKMLGLRSDSILSEYCFFDFIHPDYKLVLGNYLDQLVNEGDSTELLEQKIIQVDGTVLDVEFGATAHHCNDGVMLQITVKDISKRKRTEQALLQSEQEFRQLADMMPQFVWTAGSDGSIDYMNSRWFDYTGQTIEQTQGWGWGTVLHPDDLDPCIKQWNQVLQTGRQYEMEYRYKRARDGAYRWHLGRAFPVKDENDKVIKWIGTSTDIHDQKMAEEEARELNQKLELRVKERTAQLELANQELESFSYSVSHDLRVPLRHIVSFVELLKRHIQTLLDDKAQRYIQTISDSALNLQQLVDNLLEFSRMGRAELQQQVVDLNNLIAKVINSMSNEIADREILWHFERLPKVYADPVLLSQVFINLFSNAIKFTRDKTVAEISIKALPQDDKVILSIKDNGVGFDMKYADKLFNVFERLHSKREFEGTGIGLANVQRIIFRHGGKIWAESELKQGATFYFTLLLAGRAAE